MPATIATQGWTTCVGVDMLSNYIREAIRSLMGAKQRTFLALIGIMIGIASVIAMISIGKIVEAESLRQFQEMGTDIIKIQQGFYADDGGDTSKQASQEMTLAGLEQFQTAFKTKLHMMSPYVEAYGDMRFMGRTTQQPILGVTHSFLQITKLKLNAGRFISDLDNNRRFCVLGASAYQSLVKGGSKPKVGDRVKVMGHFCTLIGHLQRTSEGGGIRPYQINGAIIMPITTVLRLSTDASIREVILRMQDETARVTLVAEIKEYFQKWFSGLQISVTSAEELIEQMGQQLRLFTLLLGAVGSISLIVGGIGVMNIMLVSVTERRVEIGLRRAIGAQKRDIQGQFLVESILLSILGGFFGILLGLSASYFVAMFAKWQFLVSNAAIILGVGVSSLVGVFFGFYPARQAAKLDPIVALRSA